MFKSVWQRQVAAFFPLILLLLVLSSCEKPLMEGVSEDDSSENRVVLTVGEVETYINGEPTRSSLPIVETAMLPSTAALPPVPMPSQTRA